MQPVDHVTEQLWAPAFAGGDLRARVGGRTEGWVDVERYWLVPTAGRAQLLLPRESRRVQAAAATNYRGLRLRHVNAVRRIGSVLSKAGVPVAADSVRVEVRADRLEAAGRLPLAQLARLTGHQRLYASTGVRTGANRKATLSLLDETGAPVGYAKFGWNAVADGFVSTETRVLERVGGRAGPVRAPGLMVTLDYFGHPALVTEPLPLDVVGAHLSVPPPTSQEFYALTPVHRVAPPAETAQLRTVRGLLSAQAADPLTAEPAARGLRLLEQVMSRGTPVPVTERWHGDLSPWNAARSGDGTLWVWDWETAEDDVVAGLDPLHWVFSDHRLQHAAVDAIDLSTCLVEASPHLAAAGVPRDQWPVVAACYVLNVVSRACALARHGGTWANAWIGAGSLTGLIGQAEQLLQPVAG